MACWQGWQADYWYCTATDCAAVPFADYGLAVRQVKMHDSDLQQTDEWGFDAVGQKTLELPSVLQDASVVILWA